MWERSSRRSGSAVVNGLDVHLAEFFAKLARAGYTEETQQAKRRLIVPYTGSCLRFSRGCGGSGNV